MYINIDDKKCITKAILIQGAKATEMKKKKNAPETEETNTVPSPETEEKQPENAAPETENAPELTETEKLQLALAELQNKYVYLQAEYQNFRKRAAKDAADARSFAIADTLVPFLAVGDYLNMAKLAAEKSDNIDSIRQGLAMIIAEFFKAFDEAGVQKFESVGKAFDPQLHEAVSNEASDTVPEGEIIREWACGFKLGERLLRPAKVVVSSGKAEAPAEEEK